jgi:hypothetical protein
MPLRPPTPEEREIGKQNRQDRRLRKLARVSATVDALIADGPLPAWARAHTQRACKGRVLSLIVLKCGDCCGWERSEITHCEVTACPLHPVRPYQTE